MADKVYEMYDDYNEAIEKLLAFINLRDLLADSLKDPSPKNRREVQEMVAEMDKQIESTEAKLAKEYEAYQTKCRAEEELEAMSEEATEKVEKYFILVKHRMPEKLEELKTAIFTDWTPEEIQDFYDRAAIREATQLEEILGANAKQ